MAKQKNNAKVSENTAAKLVATIAANLKELGYGECVARHHLG
jgi:hypothetical protein